MIINLDMGGVGNSDPNWITVNIDSGAYHEAPDLVCDITNLEELPFEPNSVNAIRCCHTLEHLDPNVLERTLKGWHRLLKKGGCLTIVVPDVEEIFKLCLLKDIKDITAIRMLYVPEEWQSKGEGERHRWGFTESTLRDLLCLSGFEDIRRLNCEPTHYVDGYPVPNLKMEAKRLK